MLLRSWSLDSRNGCKTHTVTSGRYTVTKQESIVVPNVALVLVPLLAVLPVLVAVVLTVLFVRLARTIDSKTRIGLQI